MGNACICVQQRSITYMQRTVLLQKKIHYIICTFVTSCNYKTNGRCYQIRNSFAPVTNRLVFQGHRQYHHCFTKSYSCFNNKKCISTQSHSLERESPYNERIRGICEMGLPRRKLRRQSNALVVCHFHYRPAAKQESNLQLLKYQQNIYGE